MRFPSLLGPSLPMVVAVVVFSVCQGLAVAGEVVKSPEVVTTQPAVTVEASSGHENQTEGICDKVVEASKATKPADGKKVTKDEQSFLLLLQILGSPK